MPEHWENDPIAEDRVDMVNRLGEILDEFKTAKSEAQVEMDKANDDNDVAEMNYWLGVRNACIDIVNSLKKVMP